MPFASGTYARGVCDRCGRAVKYTQLRPEWNGLRVCTSCWDPKHPQLTPPNVRADAEALRHARPTQKEGLVIPVGENLYTPPFEYYRLGMVGAVGYVTVVVN